MNLFDELNENEYDDVEKESKSEDLAAPISRKLFIDKSERSLSDLVRMIKERQLNLQPDYQRNYVWGNKKASKFIESLLLGIPVPTIFLAENSEDATYEVVDGQQRLTAVYNFFCNNLKLTGLVTLDGFNNKKFQNLDDRFQRLLRNSRTLSVVIIKNESDPTIKFDIFQRINEGAVKLSSQELRHVVYRGEMINTLSKLSRGTQFSRLFNQNSKTVKKKIDEEFILRMIAMNELIKRESSTLSLSSEYRGSLSTSMNSFLDEYRNDSKKCESVKKEFTNNMNNIYDVFQKESFCMPIKLQEDEYKTSKVKNRTLAEFLYILFDNISRRELNITNNKSLKNSLYKKVLENDGLFRQSTGDMDRVKKRINLINDLLGDLSEK